MSLTAKLSSLKDKLNQEVRDIEAELGAVKKTKARVAKQKEPKAEKPKADKKK